MIPGRKLAFSYDRLYHTLPLRDVGLALPSDLRQSYMYLANPGSLFDESAGLMNREFRELGATLNLKSLICIPGAGCEAAASAARCGSSTLLITRNPDPFGEEKCLVSRRVAKGILLKKIDAANKVIDKSGWLLVKSRRYQSGTESTKKDWAWEAPNFLCGSREWSSTREFGGKYISGLLKAR
ncbi:unnamed protein product [Sphenostylis stenocarpa]|uniref:MnmG N-terminal domain-containing protein n=1 Tax=Sphenostylis stenocarpa TaxID=92480 RepID=A0AA86SPN9_9FABA|nr:unnamed protein product [Sphenostylis stenocarpa]